MATVHGREAISGKDAAGGRRRSDGRKHDGRMNAGTPGTERLVGELDLHPPVSVSVDESLWDAWQLIFVSGMRTLAVMDGERCSGVISDRQILTDVPLTPDALRRLRVGDLATRQPRPVTGQTSIADAAKLMEEMQSDAVAVTDSSNYLIGVVTSRDVVAWAASHLQG